MDKKTLEQELLEWCKQKEDFGLIDLRLYAMSIAGEQNSTNRAADRFIKEYLEPI